MAGHCRGRSDFGVNKPTLLHRIEWHADGAAPVPVSAEVLTLVTDPIASRERFLRTAPDLPADWFRDLGASLAALRAYPTDRRFPVHDAAEYGYLLSATYRRPVPAGCVPAFGTEHIDLNWENITAPRFQILDMEHWCLAVTGYGAAYLYLTALEVPAVAARVHEALADVLDTPSGRYAQLVAAALILRNLTRLPDPGGLAARLHRLHRHAARLTRSTPATEALMTHQLIASPYPEGHLVVRPGYDGAVRIGAARYAELRDAPADAPVPAWLAGPARAGWGMDMTGRLIRDTVLVRPETGYGYARASYEVNLGCNYDCEHCYLGEKMFAGMDWPGRERLLQGDGRRRGAVAPAHRGRAADRPAVRRDPRPRVGHGDDDPDLLQRITAGPGQDTRSPDQRRPYRLTLSLYGATEESYDGMTRRRGSFRRFMRGLAAAHEAGLPMRINIVVSNRNTHEIPQMKADR